MPAVDAVTGLRVRITIDEDGTDNPLSLPPGTIIGRIVGTDREIYHLIRLDRSVISVKDETGISWRLSDLVVSPKFKGGNLERLLTIPLNTFIPIAIAKVLSPIAADDPLLDFSKVDYFAVGRIFRILE